ncbi:MULTISPECIES: outer membrane beta-barrel protein [unclassified Helicobacter]|uniref:outer membrane beta-barrel protein n=1 Tax=unclassified Helicobacter TaxID=2593540 RepID=UPI000CF0A012|nr:MULTISPECIES: outer membrane beta-barrel protein [unclassified Helicobacter]
MKKRLCVLLVFLSIVSLGAYDRNNIFVGFGIGINDNFSQKKHTLIPSWYLLGGYEFKPLREISIMAYIESSIGLKPSGLATKVNLQVSLNADFVLEAQISEKARLGGYGGIGFGYSREENAIVIENITSNEVQNKGLMFLNAGIQSCIDESHLIRLGMKYPFDLKSITENMRLIQVFLSYAYKF